MPPIIVSGVTGSELFDQFNPIYQILSEGLLTPGITFDLSNLTFLKPLTLLPLAAIIDQYNGKILLPNQSSVSSYLSTISFPPGITTTQGLPTSTSTYIPIGKLCTSDPIGADRLIDCFKKLLLKPLNPLPTGALTAISYPIEEIVTNIFDHSRSQTGWIFGQQFPQKEYLDICILDQGRGLKKSYKEELNLDLTDQEALFQALKGHSTKESRERGFGLYTAKRMVTECLKGQCFILSDSVGYYSTPDEETNFQLKNAMWQGVIVAFRIPHVKTSIDPTPYYE